MKNTVESRYIELGYFEVSLISNRCQRPGGWQWLSIATVVGYFEHGYIEISVTSNTPDSPRHSQPLRIYRSLHVKL